MILISAGHHPIKPGVCHDGFCEHDEALRWRDIIVRELGSDLAMAVPPLVLKDKIQYIKARNPSISLEIHFNYASNLDSMGSRTLYNPESKSGKKLAMQIQEGLSRIFGPDNGAVSGWYRDNQDFGLERFIEKSLGTAVIVEPEYIHNKRKIVNNRNNGCMAVVTALLEAKVDNAKHRRQDTKRQESISVDT